MKYSIDQLHTPKNVYERRNGKSVDAVMDVIGKLMTTHNETIPFVIQRADWIFHLDKLFVDICINHFNVKPIAVRRMKYEWRIDGYSSVIRIFSLSEYENNRVRGYSVIPTFDLSPY